MELEALDHVALTVADVASSAEWYAKVLGLRRVFEEEWGFESAKHELTTQQSQFSPSFENIS